MRSSPQFGGTAGTLPAPRLRRSRAERKAKVIAVLRKGSMRPSPSIWELDRLLRATPVDLRRIGALLDGDGVFARAVWESCSQATGTAGLSGGSLDEAIVLLGLSRFRFIAASHHLRKALMLPLRHPLVRGFWERSFGVAAVGDLIGRWTGRDPGEDAFLAGVYHDVGMLPLIAAGIEESDDAASWGKSLGDIQGERRHFGLDHCVIGGLMAVSWDFPSAFIDAMVHHHDPQNSGESSRLTHIVAAACELLNCYETNQAAEGATSSGRGARPYAGILGTCLPDLPHGSSQGLARAIQDLLRELHPWGVSGAWLDGKPGIA